MNIPYPWFYIYDLTGPTHNADILVANINPVISNANLEMCRNILGMNIKAFVMNNPVYQKHGTLKYVDKMCFSLMSAF